LNGDEKSIAKLRLLSKETNKEIKDIAISFIQQSGIEILEKQIYQPN